MLLELRIHGAMIVIAQRAIMAGLVIVELKGESGIGRCVVRPSSEDVSTVGPGGLKAASGGGCIVKDIALKGEGGVGIGIAIDAKAAATALPAIIKVVARARGGVRCVIEFSIDAVEGF